MTQGTQRDAATHFYISPALVKSFWSSKPPTTRSSTRLPACLSWLFFGTSFDEKGEEGICACVCFFSLQKMSAGFPARHEKARITKDLHICQRFGAEGERGGAGGGRFITFSKVQKLNIGLFWRALPKFSTESRRVLTALRRRPLFRSALGYRRRQRGGREGAEKDTWAVTKERSLGRDDWPTSPGPRRPASGLDRISGHSSGSPVPRRCLAKKQRRGF